MKQFLYNIVLWLDVGINVIFLLGKPTESVSLHAATAREEGKKWGCVLCSIFDAVVIDHCNHALYERTKDGKNC